MPSRPAQRRASGATAALEEADKAAAELTEPVEERVLPEERDKTFESLSFSRMKLDWTSADKAMLQQIKDVVNGRVSLLFADAYNLMHELLSVVREQAVDSGTGELLTDHFGFPVWVRTPAGGYVEDWSKLGIKEREGFLFQIVTRMFDWESKSADLWGESMFAKALWQERFARGFDAPMSGTIEDRNARATVESGEEKYFALFVSYLSRRADAVVRSMTALSLRLRDTLPR